MSVLETNGILDLNYDDCRSKGLLKNALYKVLQQVHGHLQARDDALDYIERLVMQLLMNLCSAQPHTVADVERLVESKVPHPINRWAINDAQTVLSKEKGKKKTTVAFPIDKIHSLLVKDVLGYKVDTQVTLYIVAVLEFIAADIIKLLMDMFFPDDDVVVTQADTAESPAAVHEKQTYEDLVKDLVLEETQYIRDLNMIIKVFRDMFVRAFNNRCKDVDVIFSNVVEVAEFSSRLLTQFEDALEMADDGTPPLVGACFEDTAEAAEFEVYERYAEDVRRPNGLDRLNSLLQRADLHKTCESTVSGAFDAVKYVLPRLLLRPLYHFLSYFDVMQRLIEKAEDPADREQLKSAKSMLNRLKIIVEKKLGPTLIKRSQADTTLRFEDRAGRQASLAKMEEIQRSIDGWEGKDINQICNYLKMEGMLHKVTGKRVSERYVFLFDNLLVLTKQNLKRSSVSTALGEYKLKDKYLLRFLTVVDVNNDAASDRHSFELRIRDQQTIEMICKTQEEKDSWMNALVSLLMRGLLDRDLDAKLLLEEQQLPLRLPSVAQYRFAEEDSSENISLDHHDEMPLIRGGTLLKLVERLTYHTHADLKFVRIFLTTYRSFCKPSELLSLLIERYHIPDPPPLKDEQEEPSVREDLKRFRKEYLKPVQFRVLNAIRQWVDLHWYDFERHQNLQIDLKEFLHSIKSKVMRKLVDNIFNVIQRKENNTERHNIVMDKPIPPIEWHIGRRYEEYDLMTLHPLELARQITLLEFDLFRKIHPSEMIGCVWIMKDKDTTSPNLLRMIRQSTAFTFWLEKCIIEAENFDERVAVLSRILEIMTVLQDLNNFSGVLEIVAALQSAPVHRLDFTFTEVPSKLIKALEEGKELTADHYRRYAEKLRSINPPCVPFLGTHLSHILHAEEGNPNFLTCSPTQNLINFGKRRMVAEITQEIQQYQNQPYCFEKEPSMQDYLENLDPFEGMEEKEFNDYLFTKSLELEPRQAKQLPKKDKRRDYSLKSPGTKPSSAGRHGTGTFRGGSSGSERSGLIGAASPFTHFHRRDKSGGGEDEQVLLDDASSSGATPPTPSTPMTPPADAEYAVFATVLLGSDKPDGLSSPGGTMRAVPGQTSPDAPSSDAVKPPPLPPRIRKRESSTSDVPHSPSHASHPTRMTSSVDSATAAVVIGCEKPPPLPPRLDPAPQSYAPSRRTRTLPRDDALQTVAVMTSAVAPPQLPARRNSDRDNGPPSPHFMNYNGRGLGASGSLTPQLPPKTYRVTHVRKQSS